MLGKSPRSGWESLRFVSLVFEDWESRDTNPPVINLQINSHDSESNFSMNPRLLENWRIEALFARASEPIFFSLHGIISQASGHHTYVYMHGYVCVYTPVRYLQMAAAPDCFARFFFVFRLARVASEGPRNRSPPKSRVSSNSDRHSCLAYVSSDRASTLTGDIPGSLLLCFFF